MSGNVEWCNHVGFDPAKEGEQSHSVTLVVRFDKPFTFETELLLTDGSRWSGRVCDGKFMPDDQAGFAKRGEELTNGNADSMAKDDEQR